MWRRRFLHIAALSKMFCKMFVEVVFSVIYHGETTENTVFKIALVKSMALLVEFVFP